MWNNSGFDESGVGFFNGPNQMDSSQPKTTGQVRRAHGVVPLCIRQLRDNHEEEFKLFGMPTQILTIVGILREYDVQSTKATYEIEDHTGRLKAIWWLESDMSTASNLPTVKEGCYLRIYGSLRSQEGEKMLMILRMFPVDDPNEVTNHLLEVVHTRLQAEALSKGVGISMGIKKNNPGLELANSMSFMGDDSSMSSAQTTGFTPIQQKIYGMLKSVNTPAGIHRSTVLQNFPPNQHRDVNNALEFLINEGHAYSTIDNDNFKATDSM